MGADIPSLSQESRVRNRPRWPCHLTHLQRLGDREHVHRPRPHRDAVDDLSRTRSLFKDLCRHQAAAAVLMLCKQHFALGSDLSRCGYSEVTR